MNNGDMPASPIVNSEGMFTTEMNVESQSVNHHGYAGGLTKREHFAGLALQGILSIKEVYEDLSYESAASQALSHADALLEVLDEG